jgi:hypothetical protein
MSPTGIITAFHALFCRMFGHKMGSRPVVFKTQWHGCCRTHRQRPLRGRPSTSSPNSVVDAAKPIDSAPQGAAIDVIFKLGGRRCRTHQQCPSGGPPSTSSSKLGGGRCRTRRQRPRARHQRRLQPRWWTQSDPPTAPLRGPPSTLSSKLSDGRCWTHWQHP